MTNDINVNSNKLIVLSEFMIGKKTHSGKLSEQYIMEYLKEITFLRQGDLSC